jgi:hypothetical protein
VIPIFPLPNVVLFPGMPLPLHVFEPRYCAMVRDAMAGERVIGMVLLQPGWESDYEGRPPVYPHGCAGEVERCEELPDGRFNILLRGLDRFRLVAEHEGHPYRLATVEARPEAAGDRRRLERARERLVELLARSTEGAVEAARQPEVPHDVFVNALAQSLPLAPVERQSLLDCDTLLARYARLTEILDFKRLERSLGRRAGESVH